MNDTGTIKRENPENKAMKEETATKNTQDTTGKILLKELDTREYSNPLLQRTSSKDITKENFPHYQNDIKDILTQLLAHISFIKIGRKPGKIISQERIENNLTEPKRLCNLLGEYCHFLHNKNIPLPYKYLGSIAHSIKPYAGNIEATIESRNIKSEKEKKIFVFEEKRLNAMIGSILENIQKIEKIHNADENLYIKKTFSPKETSQKIIEKHTHSTINKHIQFENTITNEITIESYQEIFEIILDDLISNAIKFTPNGGKITIGIEQEYNDFIRFFVKDTGIGIEEGVDVFAGKYSTPALDGEKGTGWGLTNAKIYTEIMQRNIYHEPNIPQGTKFIFAIDKTPPQKDLQK